MFNMASILSNNFLKSDTDVCNDMATHTDFTDMSTVRAPSCSLSKRSPLERSPAVYF
jgi:hypothetical protein